jgi:hypothetical protein
MRNVPAVPRLLGLCGLLPQLACLLALWFGPQEWRYAALAIGCGYAALILAFVGGMWWGIAASQDLRGKQVPDWLWLAAVVPSLVALLAWLLWVFGAEWPGPSLIALGLALIASLWVDRRIAPSCPAWWMALRVPLSLGLGSASVLLALA